MGQAFRTRHVDAAMDRVDPGGAGEGVDNAGGAEHGQAADNAEPWVPGLLGDVCAAPNAKTAAAVRKQAPVVAENVISVLTGKGPRALYDGYGSCPLTVERGKIVLAEFTYGGKVAPSFPRWLLDGRQPTRLAWLLKARVLPPLYWKGMLKGREWMARPQPLVAEAGK